MGLSRRAGSHASATVVNFADKWELMAGHTRIGRTGGGISALTLDRMPGLRHYLASRENLKQALKVGLGS